MTPKEKAIELFNKMCDYKLDHSDAKRCTLIVVDEIINSNPYEVSKTDMDSTIDYWEEVKQEIEKL